MSCLVQRNSENKIVGVTTKTGEKSILFEEIHSNPFLGDAELSAKITYQISKNESKDTHSNGEPKLFYKTDSDKLYTDLEDIYVDGKQGTISLGYKDNKGDFKAVASFDTEANQKSKFLSEQIAEGFIEAKRKLLPNGKTVFEGKGQFYDTKRAAAEMFVENVRKQGLAGNMSINTTEATVEVFFPPTGTMVRMKNGQ
ncbi:hypothetical protein EBU94_04715, partial [bacterium]|nr:hypothetical protein [bacterium]